jgi:hypothetical protein
MRNPQQRISPSCPRGYISDGRAAWPLAFYICVCDLRPGTISDAATAQQQTRLSLTTYSATPSIVSNSRCHPPPATPSPGSRQSRIPIGTTQHPLDLVPDLPQVRLERLGVFELSVRFGFFHVRLQQRLLFEQGLESAREIRVCVDDLCGCHGGRG